jgi:hypothetical protein
MALTVSNVQAWLKQTYGAPIEVMPEENTIAKAIQFIEESKRPGDKYHRPVRLQHEQGFTYNSDHSAFTLLAAKEGVVKDALLEGAELGGVAEVSYGIAAKMGAKNSENSRSYKAAIADLIEDLMVGGEIRRECSLLYGSGASGLANIGVVDAVKSAVTTVLTVSITRESYAPGLWPQLIGAGFDFHTTGGTSHTSNAEMVLTGVNSSNTRLTFSGNATDVAAVLAGDVITFRGSRATSCVGLQAIMENTGSLFGIDAAVYPQWRCNQYPVGGPFTFDKLQEGLAQPHENGLSDGIDVYLGARAWTDLMTDEAALRRHPEQVKAMKAGYSKISFDSICGQVNLITHRYFKQGLAFGLPTQLCERVGAQDLSFSVPGNKNEWFWRELETKAGSAIRLYGDQAVLFTKPNHGVLYTGIASSGDVVPA